MREIVHAAFIDPEVASRALGALIDQGAKVEDVSVFVKEMPANWRSPARIENMATEGLTVTTAADAAAGAAKGAGVGLGVGVFAALASMAIPGVGLVLGGGALAAAAAGLIGAGAAGALAGAVTGYLRDQGVDEAAIEHIRTSVDGGGALLSVSVPTGKLSGAEVEAILTKYSHVPGAVDRVPFQEVPFRVHSPAPPL